MFDYTFNEELDPIYALVLKSGKRSFLNIWYFISLYKF